MGWEEQGRQYHGWFGTGTSGVGASQAASLTFEDRAFTVVRGAASFMPRSLAREYQAFVSRGSGEPTMQAMEAWRAAADLPDEQFRKLVAGPELSQAAVAALQAMARELATHGSLDDASRHLAAAVMEGGRASAIYRFAGAQYQAAYAEANGLLPEVPIDRPTPADPEAPKPVLLAAWGDLKCEGFSAGCQEGGSWGTTAGYIVTGRKLCRSCAVKMIGVENESGASQNEALRPYIMPGR